MHCFPFHFLTLSFARFIAVSFLALGFWHCASNAGFGPGAEGGPEGVASGAASVLGPGDVFEVRVYGEDELSGVYRISSDGKITFPLTGPVEVSGLTAAEASQKIAQQLERFVHHPYVSIFVQEFNSKKVYVFGQVRKPGTFPYEDGMNIIQAVTLAGGFERMADRGGAVVTRVIDGKEKRIKVSVKNIGEGKEPNFALKPGDIVYIPEALF